MSNITNMKNLIRFSKLSLNEAFHNDGYRYDPKTSELPRDQRIPVVDFEARLNLIFERAGVQKQPIKLHGRTVGFQIDKPDVEMFDKTMKLLSFTENVLEDANKAGVFEYRTTDFEKSQTGFDVYDQLDLYLMDSLLYEAGFNTQTYREDGKRLGFTTYDPERMIATPTRNGISVQPISQDKDTDVNWNRGMDVYAVDSDTNFRVYQVPHSAYSQRIVDEMAQKNGMLVNPMVLKIVDDGQPLAGPFDDTINEMFKAKHKQTIIKPTSEEISHLYEYGCQVRNTQEDTEFVSAISEIQLGEPIEISKL